MNKEAFILVKYPSGVKEEASCCYKAKKTIL
jgi:hypothetical protein